MVIGHAPGFLCLHRQRKRRAWEADADTAASLLCNLVFNINNIKPKPLVVTSRGQTSRRVKPQGVLKVKISKVRNVRSMKMEGRSFWNHKSKDREEEI